MDEGPVAMEKRAAGAEMSAAEEAKEAGSERAKRPHVSIGGKRMPMPRSRLARIVSGVALVLLGIVGFLPVVGFWMIPLGLVVLSYDVPAVRRLRRRMEVWWHRRRRKDGRRPDAR
ncbi:PGPGW domain-containing protein [Chelativorans petroleitrophicus]|jgi:Putative transmembrane protein (PGPGW).